MTDETPGMAPVATDDPVAKAVTMLQMLAADVRESVLDRMDPAMRERVENRMNSMPDNSTAGGDVLQRRALLRQTAQRLADRRVVEADSMADQLGDHAEAQAPLAAGAPVALPQSSTMSFMDDPLSQLQGVHPAALARAMQGERAEAWAIVLGRVEDNVRRALEQYLDETALRSILAAQQRQSELHPTLKSTIERAIARTVVPRALREQRLLFSPYPPGAHHGTAV